jgi:hypothetical protein
MIGQRLNQVLQPTRYSSGRSSLRLRGRLSLAISSIFSLHEHSPSFTLLFRADCEVDAARRARK